MSRVACEGLCKAFGSSSVLDCLDLDVPDGKVVTVLGESGSGKTTLLRLIAGFERPDAGTIALDDQVVDAPARFVPPDRRQIGFVSQEGNLFPHLTVASNVGFGLSRRERSSGRVRELLGVVGLGALGHRYPHQLSGGQQQRVALARALAPRPQLVLLDEPFSALDASLRSALRFDVMRILREQHATAILVTHDQSEALSIADLVGVIDRGRIRQFATPETLYACPADPGVARFLGEANVVPGTTIGGDVDTRFGRLRLASGAGSLDGLVLVLIRPEQLDLGRLRDRRPSHAGATGRVIHREYYGHDCLVLVDIGDDAPALRVRCLGRPGVAVGDDVAISVSGEVVAWPADPRSRPDRKVGAPERISQSRCTSPRR